MRPEDRTNEEEISFSDIIVILIKRKWWFIGTFLMVLALGLVYVFLQPVSHIITYQVEMREKYTNPGLSELYPNYEMEINYLSAVNFPFVFRSEEVFSSLKDIDTGMDYQQIRDSDSFTIKLNEETSIFDISVSGSDYEIADRIAYTLIESFENAVTDKEKAVLDEVFIRINADMEDLEEENVILRETEIAELEKQIDLLYAELESFIVDYNIELSERLEENKDSENVSFYNVIIPPNDISNRINGLQKELGVYNAKILDNKSSMIALSNLAERLRKDEDIITGRVRRLSGEPAYKAESDRLRNIGIVIILSIILGALAVFAVNFIHSSNIRDRLKDK
jgi:capsular polysaccharide biosynthesis protein